MIAREVVAALAAVRGDASVVTGPGGISGALFGAADEPATIYNMEFGYATATSLGIALAVPGRRAVALEGDGSMVAELSTFATIARYRPANLVVVVIDNGVYGTGGGTVATGTSHGTDIAAVARAAGLPDERVTTPASLDAVERDLATALREPGPWVVVVRVEPDASTASERRPRPGLDFVEASLRLQADFRARAGSA
jgi:thiamine pyrophosphate-dependent acetolactate synthase large subunit-like protein